MKPSIFERRENQIEYTKDQYNALERVAEFIDSDNKYFLISGYAGVGKTSIAENIVNYSNGVLLAPTNAAVIRLKEKMPNHSHNRFSTIHKTIYGSPDLKTGEWIPKQIEPNMVYIIDESSMIDSDVLNDLINLSITYKNKLIFIGDSFQLPPISKDPKLFSWDKSERGDIFLKENKVELTEVKRQDGEILKVATNIRNKKKAEIIDFSNDFKLQKKFGSELLSDIISNNNYVVITSNNLDRIKYNKDIRFFKYKENDKHETPVNEDEIIISVSNNEKINGEIFTINNPVIIESWLNKKINIGSVDNPIYKLYDFYHICDKKTQEHTLLIPNLDIASLHGYQLLKEFHDYDYFTEEIYTGGYTKDGKKKTKIIWNKKINISTYGYAITAHKAQGNEWDKVYIDIGDIRGKDIDIARWIYTAITRGRKCVRMKFNKHISIIDEECV